MPCSRVSSAGTPQWSFCLEVEGGDREILIIYSQHSNRIGIGHCTSRQRMRTYLDTLDMPSIAGADSATLSDTACRRSPKDTLDMSSVAGAVPCSKRKRTCDTPLHGDGTLTWPWLPTCEQCVWMRCDDWHSMPQEEAQKKAEGAAETHEERTRECLRFQEADEEKL